MSQVLRQRLSGILERRSSAHGGSSSSTIRHFSSSASSHENLQETIKWKRITIAGYVVCTALGIYNFVAEEHHESEERPAYSYLHIRNKEFPWGPDGLFERKHH